MHRFHKKISQICRCEPQAYKAGRIFHVYPAGHKGPRQEPSYNGLLAPDVNDPTRLVQPDDVDLRLRDGSAAVDAGVVLPNITDGYAGKAPDLGACELGQELPRYGPRP